MPNKSILIAILAIFLCQYFDYTHCSSNGGGSAKAHMAWIGAGFLRPTAANERPELIMEKYSRLARGCINKGKLEEAWPMLEKSNEVLTNCPEASGLENQIVYLAINYHMWADYCIHPSKLGKAEGDISSSKLDTARAAFMKEYAIFLKYRHMPQIAARDYRIIALCNELANAFIDLKRLDEARELLAISYETFNYSRSIRTRRKDKIMNEAKGLMKAHIRLAGAFTNAGRLNEAWPMLERADEILTNYPDVPDIENQVPDLIRGYTDLGTAHVKSDELGALEEARRALERAYERLIKYHYAPDVEKCAPSVTTAYNSLISAGGDRDRDRIRDFLIKNSQMTRNHKIDTVKRTILHRFEPIKIFKRGGTNTDIEDLVQNSLAKRRTALAQI